MRPGKAFAAVCVLAVMTSCQNPLLDKVLAARDQAESSVMSVVDGSQNPIAPGTVLGFPTTAPGATADISLTVTNSGVTDLVIDVANISLTMASGTEAGVFSIETAPDAQVKPGMTTTLVVRFAPPSVGSKSASLTIPTNAYLDPQFTFTVEATSAWSSDSKLVTFDKGDAAATGTMAGQHIAAGSTVNLVSASYSRAGFFFAGWATTGGGLVAYADKAAFTMGNADVTLYAVWSILHHVTFDPAAPQEEISGQMASQAIPDNTTATLNSNQFQRQGFDFLSWAGPSGMVADGASFTMGTTDVSLTAMWTMHFYTIRFSANALGASGSASTQFPGGTQPMNLPFESMNFSYFGHILQGWATSPTGPLVYVDGDMGHFVVGFADTTLYAVWALPYTVQFHLASADTVAGAGGFMGDQTVPGGVPTALTANGFSWNGHTFDGWATSEGGATVYADTAQYTATANRSLYAKWNPAMVTINFNLNGGSYTAGFLFPVTAAYGTWATLPTGPSFFYPAKTLAGWSDISSGSAKWTLSYPVTTTAPVTLYAIWQ